MQALDIALFELINAGATAPAWSIHFARFASDVLPTLLALAVMGAAAIDRRLRYAFFTALVSVIAVWVLVNVFRSVMPFQRPAFYGLGVQWAPQGARPGAGDHREHPDRAALDPRPGSRTARRAPLRLLGRARPGVEVER